MEGRELRALAEQLGGGWRVVDEHHLAREYTFRNFHDALDFTNKLGEIAEKQGHHPDILLSWGRVGVTIYTHKIDGLTESDFILAAKFDDCRQAESALAAGTGLRPLPGDNASCPAA